MTDERKPGWDKKAVNRIAREEYDGLARMFEKHGWAKGDKTYGQIAPTRVVETYGSVDSFVRAHKNGIVKNSVFNPMAAIQANPPNVWLTSYYGYDPENWGLLAFGSASDRDRFVRLSEPGALIVIYGTKSLRTNEAGKILGVQQVTHRIGPSKQFISPEAWEIKQNVPKNRDRWLHAVQSNRAWYVVPENRPSVEEFADETWTRNDARAIARYCKQMTKAEARKILGLEMFESSVFGGNQNETPIFSLGKEAMKPSRPGPVSQTGFQVSESEGPKHLYMLELTGDGIEAFIDDQLGGRKIVKVGFSKSPELRRESFNRAMPGRQFHWKIVRSTHNENLEPYPTSHHAKAGEQEMVRYLHEKQQSLGGEFFVSNTRYLKMAWEKGKSAAEEYKK